MIRDSGNGFVVMQACGNPELRVRPFPSYAGPLAVKETPTTFQVTDGRTIQYRKRNTPGYPLWESAFRHFPPDLDESLTFGAGFPLVLTVEPGPLATGGWVGDVVWGVYHLLRNCGVQVRTTRPRMAPGDYGTVFVTAEKAWPGEADGVTADRFPTTRRPDDFTPRACFTRAKPHAELTAGIVVHECMHAWGLDHVDPVKYPDNIRFNLWPPAHVYPDDEATIRNLTAPWRTR